MNSHPACESYAVATPTSVLVRVYDVGLAVRKAVLPEIASMFAQLPELETVHLSFSRTTLLRTGIRSNPCLEDYSRHINGLGLIENAQSRLDLRFYKHFERSRKRLRHSLPAVPGRLVSAMACEHLSVMCAGQPRQIARAHHRELFDYLLQDNRHVLDAASQAHVEAVTLGAATPRPTGRIHNKSPRL